MLVKERMSDPVITVHPDMPMHEALNLMRREPNRRLPVVDKPGRLVGIVSERDLLHGAPLDATSLSIWELHDLLSRVTVGKIMTRQVITVTEDTPLEDAARIMADRKIGGLPVVRNGEVVGIVTETDLFTGFPRDAGRAKPGSGSLRSYPTCLGDWLDRPEPSSMRAATSSRWARFSARAPGIAKECLR